MSRLAWLAVGVGVGATGLRRAQAAARAVAPGQVQSTVTDLDRTLRAFADDVRDTMVAREADLRSALGIATTGEAVAAQTEEASARGVR